METQEIECFANSNGIECPFCGQLVIPSDRDDHLEIEPCAHTLYIGTDFGFEYRSAAYDRLMGIEGVSDDDIDMGDDRHEEYIDRLNEPLARKFSSSTGGLGNIGVFIGFVPYTVE